MLSQLNNISTGLPQGDDSIPFDSLYTVPLSEMKMGIFTFTGYQTSKIEFNKVNESWILQEVSNPEHYATTKGVHPPFGVQVYILSEELGGQNLSLSINACNDETEYGCDDGGCIPIENRCDSKFDCIDRSDESVCYIIEVPTSYIRHVPSGKEEIIYSWGYT